ncbi:molybdopterin-dependent oxidoreductase [Chitinophaga horti]|uniref:Molybdopterin-dependent oxidoreductase n=1 Tax=Chitinophaga horti TaxID=2920382 RepID=A0ABY6JBM1_9BACT|nr:molybdopterin-dependent oxidoreductase [Chitinophaga horti]UYQ95792.1 molybdopterin-dependent oxidoreductase [Chitinophaga horti]
MMCTTRLFITWMFMFVGTLPVAAQVAKQPSLKISGEVAKPVELTASQFDTMKKTTAILEDRDGKNHAYKGVSVQEILGLAGVTTGDQLRGEHLTKYVLAKCADGYEVLFSLAELDSAFTKRVTILADEVDGTQLPVGKGPFRLIVPGERRPARSCFQVTEFVVKYAK